MDTVTRQQYLASLIVKERLGILTEKEAIELAEWKNASAVNHTLYEKLRQQDCIEEIRRYKDIDLEVGLRKYKKYSYSQKRKLLKNWVSVAAVLMLLVGMGGVWLWRPINVDSDRLMITPGSAKAVLVLGDGSMRELDKVGKEEVILMNGIKVRNSGSEISYVQADTSSVTLVEDITQFNTLKIPVGGEYMLVLADGTKVWLNSETTLRYPVKFSAHERKVYLTGEAYFEVMRDTNRPFLVEKEERVKVEVLGTSFNVRAYLDEEKVETVLEKGVVRMWKAEENVLLKPGTKAVCYGKNGGIVLDSVDTELYTTWRQGRYVFRNESLEIILHTLSRWYGMHIFYVHEEVKGMVFSGDIQKYDTIWNFLEAIELSGGVRFEVKGNTVTVCKQF